MARQPCLVRKFLEQRPDYEHLCAEVAYILEKRLKDLEIEVSTITYRTKTLNSFLEKIQRKSYVDPFTGIQDFAGIRVVYLYIQDMEKIEEAIHKEFEVLEKIEKLEEKESDRFGYLATHFIAKLGPESSGARYEDLKHLVFEIQVRTVLQDAWAIIDHHLAYKHESEVPKHLQRKLTRIAGTFEMVDEDFNEIRSAINDYVSDLNKLSQSDTEQFLIQSLDLNSFRAYLEWRFKGLPLSVFNDDDLSIDIESAYSILDKNRYQNLLQLERAIALTDKDRPKILESVEEAGLFVYDAVEQFKISMGMVDKDYRKLIGAQIRAIIESFIKKGSKDSS